MSPPDRNPLVREREVAFLLYEVFDAESLCQLEAFAEHGRETFDAIIDATRRVARDHVYPAFAELDSEPPVLEQGAVRVHPRLHELFPRIRELGLQAATRPESAGGLALPHTVAGLASLYLMAANCGIYGYLALTQGAAHLIEAFGTDGQKELFMRRMYAGEWTGTMALTEPQAGSSLADVQTVATPTDEGHYLIRGSKIFISGGDHDLADNIVHLLLARIEGAPAGTRGLSLFAVPKRRLAGDALVENDVHSAGMVHKIGWRALPSMVMSYGEEGDCHGWLVGEAHRGLAHMFQMMNEARLSVGMSGVATASVAYHESLMYARTRLQGRPLGRKNADSEPVAIIEHADVRRMLLRQKAIIEGGLALLVRASKYTDLAAHAADPGQRERAQILLDLLTPIAKSFPAERGFEANTLALQIFGGYGYSSEYPVEAWLREQKLNSIHEGTTGIQGLDLLGRRIVAGKGAAVRTLAEEVGATVERARACGVPEAWRRSLEQALRSTGELASHLGERGLGGDVDGMMSHSADFLDLVSVLVIGWQWLEMAAAAKEATVSHSDEYYQGKLAAAQYWFATEMPRVALLAERCRGADDAYLRVQGDWL
ncbi:acyl-CoA dehydrogenase [Haliangium ochraceum]|uniref:Acyl-CoA dehydrogenase domain protein n=1 Tax=Haliangium ochraceum (strain DSM 14365 / JCM 11303 / SMP-2) TaxID=502025 RepID=D0LRA3_HALO1|nr:acyl-CoA dehydrogenase [Haliangium ochraceum]ACY17131.1 acyl-CoA dehydrogenase domain protein [Haliangium ochraceum DSM 14365]